MYRARTVLVAAVLASLSIIWAGCNSLESECRALAEKQSASIGGVGDEEGVEALTEICVEWVEACRENGDSTCDGPSDL